MLRSLNLFLCHSSRDKSSVRSFYRRLKRDGFDPWIDEEKLLPGQDWEHEIRRAVGSADLVIVCLSAQSVSRDGYIHKEIKLALDVADEKPEGTVYLIPAKLEECEIPERLRRWQWVNLFEETGYEKLVRTFRQRADMIGAAIPSNVPAHFFYAPAASAILVTPDGREIYAADTENGSVTVIENMPHCGGGLKTKARIDLNRSGTPAHPERLALNPETNIIYVTDPRSDDIILIDRGHNNQIAGRIPVGRLPRSIVFTSTGEKAYVSNEGPIPQGSISVIDAQNHRVIRQIRGVNTPEGLAISSGDHRLYVASQSGYGEDPVFVIDTLEDRVLEDEAIVGMAVGVSVAASSKHHKLYVARGNFSHRDPETGYSGAPLTVIDLLTRRELRTHTLHMSVNLAVLAPSDDCVLVGNGEQITIIETAGDMIVRSFGLGAAALGIAISRENAVYVLLPGSQIKLFGLSGLARKT
jgi:YVTN family beta-propeller protein